MSKVDAAVLQKAVTALFDHDSKQKGSKNLLIDEYASPILVQIQLLNDIKKPVVRPVRVKIPHTLFDTNQEDHKVCYFCKSEDKEVNLYYYIHSQLLYRALTHSFTHSRTNSLIQLLIHLMT